MSNCDVTRTLKSSKTFLKSRCWSSCPKGWKAPLLSILKKVKKSLNSSLYIIYIYLWRKIIIISHLHSPQISQSD